jgi:hypothetical protein
VISIVHPYYNHRGTFAAQFKRWSTFSNHAKKNFEVIVVDDGSPDFPCKLPSNLNGVDLKVLRIEENILWNTAGAANLGISEAKYDWILHADFDLCVSPLCADLLLKLDLSDPMVRYWPMTWHHAGRDRPDKYSKRHLNSYLMNKAKFWETGGYDEDFGGAYGYQDILFRDESEALGLTEVELKPTDAVFEKMIRCPDAHVQNVDRVRQNGGLYKRKVCGVIPRNYDILRFNWHREE